MRRPFLIGEADDEAADVVTINPELLSPEQHRSRTPAPPGSTLRETARGLHEHAAYQPDEDAARPHQAQGLGL